MEQDGVIFLDRFGFYEILLMTVFSDQSRKLNIG